MLLSLPERGFRKFQDLVRDFYFVICLLTNIKIPVSDIGIKKASTGKYGALLLVPCPWYWDCCEITREYSKNAGFGLFPDTSRN